MARPVQRRRDPRDRHVVDAVAAGVGPTRLTEDLDESAARRSSTGIV
jgi:hypothetical protein